MWDFRKILAIFIAKLTQKILNFFPSGGTALPGLLALKVDPQLLAKLKSQLKFSIIVSGTNGKTTTTRLMGSIFSQANINYLHNRTGSNLLRGIASTLVKKSSIFGQINKSIGLWEVDEAVLPEAIVQLQPKIVVLTNLFRDQLDRYGEIDTLAQKWQQALKKLPPATTIVLNSDDPHLSHMGKELGSRVIYFGIKDKKQDCGLLSHASDATFCPQCLTPLKYQACYISHLGNFTCPQCGPIQAKPNFQASKIKINKNNMEFEIRFKDKMSLIKLKLFGLYNVYNALASFGVGRLLKIKKQVMLQAFKEFKPAFGRLEKIKVKNKVLTLMLAKNPTGANQVLETLKLLAQGQRASLLLALNDLIADGRDVSWIWDVDFENLKKIKFASLLVSGLRAEDLGLRLKYGEVKGFVMEKSLKKGIKMLLNSKADYLYLIPTYTAMLKLRKVLYKMGLVHTTWRD